MSTKIIKVKIRQNIPNQQHRVWENNNLVLDNQNPDDRYFKMPIRETIKSENWWAMQEVTNLQGKIEMLDVFEYGQYYVVMKGDDRMQVVHDNGNQWHYVWEGD